MLAFLHCLFDPERTKKIELVLRKFGVTSAGAYRMRSLELLNIQGTSTGEVIDFGGFLAVEKFSKIATTFYGQTILLQPETLDFIQPSPDVRVPLSNWGTSVSGIEDPKKDNIWIWSHELAEAITSGRADRHSVWLHFQNLLNPVNERLHSYTLRHCSRIFLP